MGCILFLVYINDLPKNIDTPCVLFADDVSLLFKYEHSADFKETLKQSIGKVTDWLSDHNLIVNYSKTKLIEFIPYQKTPLNVELSINNSTLEKVNTCTLLGIEIDSHLNWKIHTEKVKSKLSRFTYALYHLKLSTDKKTALAAYYAYAHAWLTYGLILWGNSTDINDVFILQKKCIRILVNIDNMDSCRPHFAQLGILTLTCMYILDMCKFVRKNQDLFKIKKKSKYTPRTNNQNKFAIPGSRVAMHGSSPYVSAIKIFNNLPNELRGEQNTNKFNKKLKELLSIKTYYNLSEFYNDKL